MEIVSEESLISFIAPVNDFIWPFPSSAIFFTVLTRSLAVVASEAFFFVFSAISLIEAVTCCNALACSVEPCASAWLALATCSAPIVTCIVDSCTLPSALLLLSTSLCNALPRRSFSLLGVTSIVKSPFEIASAIAACSLIVSAILTKASISSPRSSSCIFVQSVSTSPTASFFAATESFETGPVIVLVIEKQSAIITIIHTIQIAIRTTPSVLTVVSILTDSASASSTILAIILSNTSLASSETTILLFSISSSAAVKSLALVKEIIISAESLYLLIHSTSCSNPCCTSSLYWSRYTLKISNFVSICANSSSINLIVSCCLSGISLYMPIRLRVFVLIWLKYVNESLNAISRSA